ncbi:LacI family transcriptional regulator [Nonlabens sp. Ci31]|uniref:LacI family DNA-binding transcriptional regulator n=1 Tax=Nonlabens sp. Ci31 TaxID=2608253 RepID=UPI0014638BD8|nr:LacI family DNA-binding transcriptional regulator [Nonlabens sp. Ci31]QJP35176.1 LacI family transcriptional regulator [Nonlabens sp. Ci31]
MKKEKVTLKQLADLLNYSISTISKALNNSEEINSDTKLKIIEAARELGYKFSQTSLKTNKTIVVIIPDIRNDFFAQVLNGLEVAATENNFKIITGFSNESYDKEVAYLSALNKESIDGFIIAAARETQQVEKYKHFEELIDLGIPLVMFDRVIDELECDKIVNDDYQSGQRAFDFLLESGDRTICMASTISLLSVGKLREKGIRASVEMNEDVSFLVITASDEEEYSRKIEKALKFDGIQSIIALDQIAGVLALNKAHELHIKIPEELQLICYSDGLLSNYSFPKMSVIDQQALEIGKKAFIRMLNLINNTDKIKVTRVHTLKSSLIKRGTTR